MNKEQAIEVLQMVEAHGLADEAKRMAIQSLSYDDARYHEEHGEVIVDKAVWEDAKRALEQEPSGDLISRQAVLDLAKFDERKGLGTIIHALDVEQLPSVKPQPKTGHWIEHPEIKTITPEIMFYECSECGDKQCFCKSDIHKKHFCNYCGARMVEPTCDTCEYNTAVFNPCNACENKSEYKPQERSE